MSVKHLIIGGRGLVGTALRRELQRRELAFVYTVRPERLGPNEFDGYPHDLNDSPWHLPEADVVYLVAAVASFVPTEQDNRATWRVNVDGILNVAAKYQPGKFLVYVSSDAVEYAGRTELGRQKAHVEAVLRNRNAAIVRPARITEETVDDFARVLVGVGLSWQPGLVRWPNG